MCWGTSLTFWEICSSIFLSRLRWEDGYDSHPSKYEATARSLLAYVSRDWKQRTHLTTCTSKDHQFIYYILFVKFVLKLKCKKNPNMFWFSIEWCVRIFKHSLPWIPVILARNIHSTPPAGTLFARLKVWREVVNMKKKNKKKREPFCGLFFAFEEEWLRSEIVQGDTTFLLCHNTTLWNGFLLLSSSPVTLLIVDSKQQAHF